MRGQQFRMSLVQYYRALRNRANIIYDSETLHFKPACSDTVPDDKLKKEGRKVVETLGRLALVVTGSAYIHETLCPQEEYLEPYRRRQKEVLGCLPKHTSTDYRRTVYTIWQVSLHIIEYI